jgi:hypothetical protein
MNTSFRTYDLLGKEWTLIPEISNSSRSSMILKISEGLFLSTLYLGMETKESLHVSTSARLTLVDHIRERGSDSIISRSI